MVSMLLLSKNSIFSDFLKATILICAPVYGTIVWTMGRCGGSIKYSLLNFNESNHHQPKSVFERPNEYISLSFTK